MRTTEHRLPAPPTRAGGDVLLDVRDLSVRIGPAEIEDCLLQHPAVHLAGVVGQPDPVRGHVVAAFVKLAEGYAAHPDLAEQIALHVKARLAAYEYPRAVYFIDTMPMTTTGKIVRATLRAEVERLAAAKERAND